MGEREGEASMTRADQVPDSTTTGFGSITPITMVPLARRALRYALHPSFDDGRAARALVEHARGDAMRLRFALARIRRTERRGEIAQLAISSLEAALRLVEAPVIRPAAGLQA